MAKAKKVLTVRAIDALRPAPAGKRYEVMDASVPGFGVRVTDKGKRTFVLVARFPGSSNPTRREIGEVGSLTLEAARVRARNWIELIKSGTDPKVEAERHRQAELRKQRHTFAAVAEDYIARHVAAHRTAKDAERVIRKELIDPLGHKPVTEITREDVTNILLKIKDRPAPYQARIVYQHMQALYAWAINLGIYGIETSPTDRIKPGLLIGEKKPRQRVLNDGELRAFWHATEQLAYPFSPMFQLLLLTGCRKTEIGEASWDEIDLDKKLLTIPQERFKSDATHLVPLSRDAMAVIEALPRFARGAYVFTLTGENPVSDGGISRAKKKLDQLMADEFGHAPEPFVLHDLRRTVRTKLASLRIPDVTAEMIIGRKRPSFAAGGTSAWCHKRKSRPTARNRLGWPYRRGQSRPGAPRRVSDPDRPPSDNRFESHRIRWTAVTSRLGPEVWAERVCSAQLLRTSLLGDCRVSY